MKMSENTYYADKTRDILRAIEDAGESATKADLTVQFGQTTDVGPYLTRMLRRGDIIRLGRGRYRAVNN